MSKKVIILIGPKGSGKTHIGTVAAKQTDMTFLPVEPLWLALKPGEDGWSVVEREVDHILEASDEVIIESLGGSDGFKRLHANLASKYAVKLVRVTADLDTCLKRVKSRPNRDHIPVSDAEVERYNALAVKVALDWDAEINNADPATDDDILRTLRSL